MTYQFSSLKQVLDTFTTGESLGVTEMANRLGKAKTLIHRYVKELVKQGQLEKTGSGPHTKYKLTASSSFSQNDKQQSQPVTRMQIPYKQQILLDDIFLKFGADGKQLIGTEGFLEWCLERNLDPHEKAEKYIEIHSYLSGEMNECGLLDATHAFTENSDVMYLDKVYYADQYKWMDFGRGKLAELTFYGKQSQDYELLMQSISPIKHKILCSVHNSDFDALAVVPWSIKRENQLLKILKKELSEADLPFVNIIKYYPNKIPIPQKSLKTREQRIKNATNTIFVDDQKTQNYKKVLLIDDFVGSGATLNLTAKKLKEAGVQEVVGCAFVGNMNLSYEVIREI